MQPLVKKINILFCGTLLVLVPTSRPAHSAVKDLPAITVLASSSASLPITEIARRFSREQNIAVIVNYGEPALIASQIIDGASADIFISEDPAWLRTLKNQGLLDVYTQITMANNSFVVATSADNSFSTDELNGDPLATLRNLGFKPVLLSPENSSQGANAQKALLELSVYTAEDILFADSPSALEEILKQPNGNYFSLLYSNDPLAKKLKILHVINSESHQVPYYANAVAGENMEDAREFLKALQQESSKQTLAKYSFITE